MASIEVRTKANGSKAYKAEVVVRVDGKRRKRSATFDRRSTAVAWSKKIEKQMKSGNPNDFMKKASKPKTVADAIGKYLDSTRVEMGSTKRQVLGFVRDGRCDFSDVHLKDVSSHDVRAFAEELAKGERGPATVSSYLTHTCFVLSVSEDDHGPDYHVSLDALERGKRSARRAGLAGKSEVRDRRPTLEELDLLMKYFLNRYEDNKRCVPMHLILPFAIFGCRRQSEITGLKWSDIDGDEILVRAMKNPRKPQGVDMITSLTDEAKDIIKLHGEKDKTRIFPYNPGTISRLFTDACKLLDIPKLHFHDLRHEGVSWLREKGWSTSHVMMVSGHASTQTLDRYTRLKTRGDKFEGWSWFERLQKLYETPA